jgi:hypothetical protein
MSKIIGIDLVTSNSAAAVMVGGKLTIIQSLLSIVTSSSTLCSSNLGLMDDSQSDTKFMI